jgi:pyruvate formate lyase activating enzyme
MEALYSSPVEGGIKCQLCPHMCLINDGKAGICKVRRNIDGKLVAETWGRISAMHMDPIEKKPLYHFFPGRPILSLGSVGCNMHCLCCQNWQISQVSVKEFSFEHPVQPDEIVNTAIIEENNLGIAYTYNEPAMWFEYMIDIAKLVQLKGLKNVMVSNGYVSEKPMDDLLHYIDAFNIDLKGFTENFYRKFTGSRLDPILRNLIKIRNSGRHLEITTLIVPGQNDDPRVFSNMVDWISGELGKDTILHLSRYHPAYKFDAGPTSADDMKGLLEIAQSRLFYVYAGNIQLNDYHDTRCSECNNIIIRRDGYHVSLISVNKQGACMHCGNKVIIC